jgi:hypothetical protein
VFGKVNKTQHCTTRKNDEDFNPDDEENSQNDLLLEQVDSDMSITQYDWGEFDE